MLAVCLPFLGSEPCTASGMCPSLTTYKKVKTQNSSYNWWNLNQPVTHHRLSSHNQPGTDRIFSTILCTGLKENTLQALPYPCFLLKLLPHRTTISSFKKPVYNLMNPSEHASRLRQMNTGFHLEGPASIMSHLHWWHTKEKRGWRGGNPSWNYIQINKNKNKCTWGADYVRRQHMMEVKQKDRLQKRTGTQPESGRTLQRNRAVTR